MSRLCEGRVAIVTGAGRGIGRSEALELGRQGAHLVVNDLGAARDGSGASAGPAQEVVEEIVATGGVAVANTEDVSSWEGAHRLVEQAIETFGRLDVVVNNAGILRDRTIANMTESEWDAVIAVHLKGTAAMTHWAANHWRGRAKAGEQNDARIINTASASGIYGNTGQSNYGAAKAGIAGLTIITSKELERYGVLVNAIAPGARTRMTEDRRIGEIVIDEGEWDPYDPDNVAPLVAWLASSESAPTTGRVFNIGGGLISVAEGWRAGPSADKGARWDAEELGTIVPGLVADALPNADLRGSTDRQPTA